MNSLVDTNIFVRFLTGDEPEKAERCLQLFERGRSGEIDLYTTESIITEIVYVLSSKQIYAKARVDIVDKLSPLLEGRGIRLDHKATIIAALARYRDGRLDIEDCLAVEHAVRLGLDGIHSYDRRIGREGDVTRFEP